MIVRDEMNNSVMKLLKYRVDQRSELIVDSLDYHLAMTIFRPTFDPALGVTDELINSGKLYLIRNGKLRTSLTNWSGKYYNELSEEEKVVSDFILDHYYPFLVRHYQLRNSLAQITGSQLWDMVHMDDYGYARPSRISSTSTFLANDLLDNGDFEDLLITLSLYLESTNDQSIGVMRKIEEILSMIEGEL